MNFKINKSRNYPFIILFLIIFFCVSYCWSQTSRIQIMETPAKVEGLLHVFSSVEPVFPAPQLLPEPEYTWGSDNTIFWNGDSLQNAYQILKITLQFYEIEALIDSTVRWAYVDLGIDSALFKDLPEGISIEYRLRYFGFDSTGVLKMSHWSLPEISIQDINPPVLELWDIVHLQKTDDINWIIGRNIQNHVVAYDTSFGKIMAVVIHEISSFADKTVYNDIEPPQRNVNEIIPFTIDTPANEPLTLELWILDVAEHASPKVSISLFWWPYEGEEGRMVCFPNPFNPEKGEASIIKIDTPNTKQARIFDLFGNHIRTLIKEVDDHFFEWDGKDERGNMVSNGGYICVVEGKNHYCKVAVFK